MLRKTVAVLVPGNAPDIMQDCAAALKSGCPHQQDKGYAWSAWVTTTYTRAK
jgi:hypothetical protein